MATANASMEPIPLRTLTVLLNYERMISDPRFMGVHLLKSSIADPAMVTRARMNYPQIFANEPKTVQKTHFHFFEPSPTAADCAALDSLSAVSSIHPNADQAVHALTRTQLELIYYETRGHSGCFKAIGMYEYFFDLCPTGQELSIQIADEKPIILDHNTRQILKFKVDGPKQSTLASVNTVPPCSMMTGREDNELHAVLAFPNPTSQELVVVDMTRMQYGEAARGPYGENYFLGTLPDFLASIYKVCTELRNDGTQARLGAPSDKKNELRMRRCAKKVWERWQNREKEGWCNFCGKPGDNLMNCGACKMNKVRYCCKEHQKNDWKLHKFTCEKTKK